MNRKLSRALNGAVAGAAGTTMLNAVGYTDMALRGRPASSTPDQVAERLARLGGLSIPGTGQARQNRREGLGALAGALGVSDPRTWDAASWLSDIVPHLAFGAVTYAALAEPPGVSAPPAKSPAFALAGRAAALGAATGMRSTVALAALILRRSDGLPAVLHGQAARSAAAIADAGELVMDKLPNTPSRLDPPGLIGRVVSAALAAAVLARSGHRRPVPAMLIASACAVAAAKVCHDARAALARRVPDPVVAVAEDALAIGLAALGS